MFLGADSAYLHPVLLPDREKKGVAEQLTPRTGTAILAPISSVCGIEHIF
jgi:hypothetical protein